MEKENKIMKLGFIGTGNMAGAIMGGIIRNEIFKPEEIIGADISKESRERSSMTRTKSCWSGKTWVTSY